MPDYRSKKYQESLQICLNINDFERLLADTPIADSFLIYRTVFQSCVVYISRSLPAQGILVALSISVFWFCRHSSICAQVRLTEYTKIRCKMISYEPKMLVKSNWPLPPPPVPSLPLRPAIVQSNTNKNTPANLSTHKHFVGPLCSLVGIYLYSSISRSLTDDDDQR